MFGVTSDYRRLSCYFSHLKEWMTSYKHLAQIFYTATNGGSNMQLPPASLIGMVASIQLLTTKKLKLQKNLEQSMIYPSSVSNLYCERYFKLTASNQRHNDANCQTIHCSKTCVINCLYFTTWFVIVINFIGILMMPICLNLQINTTDKNLALRKDLQWLVTNEQQVPWYITAGHRKCLPHRMATHCGKARITYTWLIHVKISRSSSLFV